MHAPLQPYQPMTTDWSKHIAANIAKVGIVTTYKFAQGSSLCPIGQSVMGGAMGKGAGEQQVITYHHSIFGLYDSNQFLSIKASLMSTNSREHTLQTIRNSHQSYTTFPQVAGRTE